MPKNAAVPGSANLDEILHSRTMDAGDENYRAYVGPPRQYDCMGATQFNLATSLGLREEHFFLDVGCGSLRSGRMVLQYLLPGRYHGMEPNDWLWQDAFEKEIGTCVSNLKGPVFDNDVNFTFSRFDRNFDFIFAQSIFSHCGIDLLTRAIANGAGVMHDDSQFVFTVLTEAVQGYHRLPDGMATSGWIYPGCVTYTEVGILELAQANGLYTQKLPWFHPRQQWYRAVKSKHMLIDDVDTAFQNGRVLFDPRFT